jgi:hypothetical protein
MLLVFNQAGDGIPYYFRRSLNGLIMEIQVFCFQLNEIVGGLLDRIVVSFLLAPEQPIMPIECLSPPDVQAHHPTS